MKTGKILGLIVAMGLMGAAPAFAAGSTASDAGSTGKATAAFFQQQDLRDSGVWVTDAVKVKCIVEKAGQPATTVALAERTPGVVDFDTEHVAFIR